MAKLQTRADARPTVTIFFSQYAETATALTDLAAFVQHVSTIRDTVFRLLPDDCDPLIKRQLVMLDDLITKAKDIDGLDLAAALHVAADKAEA